MRDTLVLSIHMMLFWQENIHDGLKCDYLVTKINEVKHSIDYSMNE